MTRKILYLLIFLTSPLACATQLGIISNGEIELRNTTNNMHILPVAIVGPDGNTSSGLSGSGLNAGGNMIGSVSLTASTLSGSLTSAGNLTFTSAYAAPNVEAQLSGTWTATLTFDYSDDAGSTWQQGMNMYPPCGQSGNVVTTTTANGNWVLLGPHQWWRVRTTAFTSGTILINFTSSYSPCYHSVATSPGFSTALNASHVNMQDFGGVATNAAPGNSDAISNTNTGGNLPNTSYTQVLKPFSGGWVPLLMPDVFKPLINVAASSTPGTIWTPVSGNKFVFEGYSLGSNVTGNYVLFDNTNTITAAFIAASTTPATVYFGNGYISSAANNKITVTGPAAGVLTGIIYGTERAY